MIKPVALAALLSYCSLSLADEPVRVGELTVARGEALSGYIDIAARDDEGTRIPVSVIRGLSDGPTLALIAGTHGYEYPGITALQRIRQDIDAGALSGTLLLVHIANPPSFYGRTIYYSPADGENLNRVFPGKADGTTSERIAYAITTQIIEQADYVIDLHAGDGNEALRPYVYMPITGNAELDRKSKGLAVAFGLDHIVIDQRPLSSPDQSLYTDQTALSRGIAAITTETGQMGSNDDHWVDMAESGVWNVLRHLGMYPGEAVANDGIVWLTDYEVIRTPATGIFQAAVKDGYAVATGTLLGTLLDPFGNSIQEFRAPFEGVVNYVVGTPPVSEGEPVAMISKLAEH